MTSLRQSLHHRRWIILLALAATLVQVPLTARAQNGGLQNINECSSQLGDSWVDASACFYGNSSTLMGYVSAGSNNSEYVPYVNVKADIYDGGTLVASSGYESGSAVVYITPQQNHVYTLHYSYQECYDSTGDYGNDSSNPCSWGGGESGTALQVEITASTTLSVTTSNTPSAYGSQVTFTATISNGVTGTVSFYDSSTLLGSGTITGTTASYLTSALAAGAHTITAHWAGNASYSAVTSNAISQMVNSNTPAAGTVYSFTGNYDATGNLLSYTDSAMGAWGFGYDALNRLVAAMNYATTSATQQYANNYGCWSYDSFGNRLLESISTTPCTGTPPLTSWAQYNSSNRMTATHLNTNQANGYDLAGDVTNDGAHDYLYDGEGRICAVHNQLAGTMTGYLYDADGTRVAKGTITSWSCDPDTAGNGFQTTADYILGPGGEQGTEISVSVSGGATSAAWSHTNVYAAGKLLATYDLTNKGLHFYLDDPLGTRRAQTDYAGVLEQTCQSLPFGDALNCTGSTTAPTEHHFTGKERDSESGNDYFEARYYSSAMGRYMSPDWSAKQDPVPYAKLDNPQTLNLYSYVQNNPLSSFDDDGHVTIEIRYNAIGPGYTHSYIVVTDRNGTQTYYRAGPSAGGPSGSGASQLSSAAGGSSGQSSGSGSSGSNSSNSSSPGSGGGAQGDPWGQLVGESGSYVPGTVDYNTNPAASVTLLSNDAPAGDYTPKLDQYQDSVNQSNIPYNPLSTNSNAYATGAANALGLTVPKPPVNAPGASTKLPIPAPAPPTPKPPPPPPCSVAGTCK